MRNVKMFKLAAASLAFTAGVATVATTGFTVAANAGTLTRGASAAAKKAESALAKRKGTVAVEWAEKAVAADPQNANYRYLLGEAYLSAGRFASADQAFSDTLNLSPGHDRATLKLALSRIAMGRNTEAVSLLNDNREKLSASDYGLALALAGDTANGVRALEAAARSADGNAKVRQNLALGYALNGQWYESRAVAAQDLPLNIVDQRMIEWAAFARPSAAWDQVAGVLGVKPAFDSGQPVSLALAAPAGAPEYAAATPAEPETVAAAEPYAAPVVASAPVAAFEIPASSAAPVEAASYIAESQPEPVAAPLIKSDPAPIKTKAVAAPKAKLAVAKTSPQTTTLSGGGKYVVQLGAFSKASSADAAWKSMSKRTAALSGYDHSASKVQVNKASVYRLAVSGFTSRDDAGRVCAQVRSSGGACFVRAVGGDTNIRFAKRGTGTRLASAKASGGKKVAVRKTVTTKRTVKVAAR